LPIGEVTVMGWGRRRVHYGTKALSGGSGQVDLEPPAYRKVKILHLSGRFANDLLGKIQLWYTMNINGTATAMLLKDDSGSAVSWDGELTLPQVQSLKVLAYGDTTNRSPTINAQIVYQMWRDR